MFADCHIGGEAMVLAQDHFLKSVVEFAERGLSLPITLSVGGATIEGILISEEEYFEQLSQIVQAAAPDELEQAEHLREVLRSAPSRPDERVMREEIYEGVDPEKMRTISEAITLLYIHLRDTRILPPSGEFVGMVGPWRGKQSAVDGYWLGGLVS
jgi:hypothetical protein